MKKEEKARKRRYDILDAIAQVSMEEFSYLDVKPFLKDIKAREIRMLGRDIISVVQGSSGRRFRKIERPCSEKGYFKRVKGYRKIKDARRMNQVCMERSPNAKYSRRVST